MPTDKEVHTAQEAGTSLQNDGEGRRNTPRTSRPSAGVLTRQQEPYPIIDNTSWTPTAIHQALKAAEYGELARVLNMGQKFLENDSHLASVFQTRKLTAAKAKSLITPPEGYEDDAGAQLAVKYLNAVLTGIAGYKDLNSVLVDGVFFPLKAMEIEWRDVVPVAIHETSHDDWRWQDGGLQYRNTKGEWLPAPQDKFVIHSPRGNSPQLPRRGLVRPIAYPWVLKHFATRDWAAFTEVFGMPTILARVPDEWEDGDARLTKLWSILRSMSNDGFAILNQDIPIEMLAKGVGAGGSPHPAFVLWCDQQMSKCILGQTLTTDTSGATGTYAAAKVHREVQIDISEADVEGIAETKRRDLFAPIIGYGLGWDFVVPVENLAIEDPEAEERDANKLDRAVNKLGLPVPVAEGYRLLRIRPPEEGEEVLPGEAQSTQPPTSLAKAKPRPSCSHSLAAAEDLDETQIALMALAQLGADEWNDLNGQFVMNDIALMVRENPDLSVSDAIPRLATLYPTLPVEDLQNAISEAMNSAAADGLIEVDAEADNPPEDREDGEEREAQGEGPGRDDKPTE